VSLPDSALQGMLELERLTAVHNAFATLPNLHHLNSLTTLNLR
jgi:hypothetical protein